MTLERAKELAPIIAAYGEGKRIQYYDEYFGVPIIKRPSSVHFHPGARSSARGRGARNDR